MQNYKIVVAYDGTDFCGWQQQPNGSTVQAHLKKTFEHAFKSEVSICGASRTDSGVHAFGQVARAVTSLDLPEEYILEVWNRILPKSIFIRSLEKVCSDFHPMYKVAQKTYYYHLFLKRPNPFLARFGCYYKFMDFVDLEKFHIALNLYVGEHDFGSFCKMDKTDTRSTIKKIDSITVKKFDKYNLLRVEIRGKSFLRFQIRRMVGYALDLARQESKSLEYLENILNNPSPNQILTKADACGLCLRKIVYKNETKFK